MKHPLDQFGKSPLDMPSLQELDALFDEIRDAIDAGLEQVRLRHLSAEAAHAQEGLEEEDNTND